MKKKLLIISSLLITIACGQGYLKEPSGPIARIHNPIIWAINDNATYPHPNPIHLLVSTNIVTNWFSIGNNIEIALSETQRILTTKYKDKTNIMVLDIVGEAYCGKRTNIAVNIFDTWYATNSTIFYTK